MTFFKKGTAGPTPFLILLGAIILLIAVNNFDRYYIRKDYPVQADIACDPTEHSCFTADPSIADPAFQTEPYAKVHVDTANVPMCLEEHSCTNFTCAGIAGCTLTYCSAGVLADGESCTASAE